MSLSIEQPRRWRLRQFRLSTLLLAMAVFASIFCVLFTVLPRYVDGWKVVSGQVLIHLTPAAQESLFDPPAPMGPMHETKVIVLSSLAYNAATVFVVLALFVWLVSRMRRYFAWHWRPSDANQSPSIGQDGIAATTTSGADLQTGSSAWRRIHTALAGGLTGAIVGAVSLALMLKTLDGVPQSAASGCFVGVVVGALMAKRGIEPACITAGVMGVVATAWRIILLAP